MAVLNSFVLSTSILQAFVILCQLFSMLLYRVPHSFEIFHYDTSAFDMHS